MGQRFVDDNAPAAKGILAADFYVEEEETCLVASQTGTVTIVAGDLLALDTTSYGGTVRTNVVFQGSTSNLFGKGIALESLTIPATTAAGDRFLPIKLLRRGFHPAVNVTTPATLGHCVLASATPGRGTSTVGSSTTVLQHANGSLYGTVMGAGAGNLVPVWVSMDKH